MEPNLQQALADVLNSSLGAIQSGVTFLQAEIPDVIKQLLMWELTRNLIVGGGLLLVVLVGLYLAVTRGLRFSRASIKREKALAKYNSMYYHTDDKEDYEAAKMAYYNAPVADPADLTITIMGGLISVAFSAPAAFHLLAALKVWIAPKIFLVEYAARLVK